jgi:hypothetical protein
MPMLIALNPYGRKRYAPELHPLGLDSFKSELKDFPFHSDVRKKYPLTQQAWREIRKQDCSAIPPVR